MCFVQEVQLELPEIGLRVLSPGHAIRVFLRPLRHIGTLTPALGEPRLVLVGVEEVTTVQPRA